jgi:hypothetical protein
MLLAFVCLVTRREVDVGSMHGVSNSQTQRFGSNLPVPAQLLEDGSAAAIAAFLWLGSPSTIMRKQRDESSITNEWFPAEWCVTLLPQTTTPD